MKYKNLTKAKRTTPGVADNFLVAPLSWFKLMAEVPNEVMALPSDANVIKGTHEFLPGKGFIKVRCQPFVNQFNSASFGEVGSLGATGTLDVKPIGSYEELHTVLHALFNEPVIALIKDAECKDDTYYQVGCDCKPAYISQKNFGTGQANSGKKGYDLMIMAQCPEITFYKGDVTPYTADTTPTVMTAYDGKLTSINAFVEADYTVDSWLNLQTALAANVVTTAHSDEQVAMATANIGAAGDALVEI